MTDVRDALGWMRNKRPAIARARGVAVDATNIVAIGWSTGGHLAMTTAWTCEKVGQEPPAAILCFHGPTDFESEGTSSVQTSSGCTSRLSPILGTGCIRTLSLTILLSQKMIAGALSRNPERSMALI